MVRRAEQLLVNDRYDSFGVYFYWFDLVEDLSLVLKVYVNELNRESVSENFLFSFCY